MAFAHEVSKTPIPRTVGLLFPFLLLVLGLLVSSHGRAQNFIAPVIGTLSGFVEDDQGNLVAPRAAISATVTASQTDDGIIAQVTGTASCTDGLGLHIVFEAQYDVNSGEFTGQYSDVPGVAPDKEIVFEPTGGASWNATLQGSAPAPDGLREYDLVYSFEVPDTAIFASQFLPDDLIFGGLLQTDVSVPVPSSRACPGIAASSICSRMLASTCRRWRCAQRLPLTYAASSMPRIGRRLSCCWRSF